MKIKQKRVREWPIKICHKYLDIEKDLPLKGYFDNESQS